MIIVKLFIFTLSLTGTIIIIAASIAIIRDLLKPRR